MPELGLPLAYARMASALIELLRERGLNCPPPAPAREDGAAGWSAQAVLFSLRSGGMSPPLAWAHEEPTPEAAINALFDVMRRIHIFGVLREAEGTMLLKFLLVGYPSGWTRAAAVEAARPQFEAQMELENVCRSAGRLYDVDRP